MIKKLLTFTRKNLKTILIGILALILVLCGAIFIGNQHKDKNADILKQLAPDGRHLFNGADDSAPPVRFVDDDGVYKGVVVDYMNLLSLKLGIEIQTVPYKWEEGLEALKNG